MRRLAYALLAVLLLASCAKETPAPPAPAASAGAKQDVRRDGGRLVRRLETDLTTLDYFQQTTDDDRQVFALLFDPLIDLDAQLNPIPGIVERWHVEEGGRTYVFHLDPRATFSDGKPVRASDVIFTLNRIVSTESVQFASWFEGLDREKTKAMDDSTLRVVFDKPRAGQLMAFNIGVLPEHVYGKGKPNRIVGTGPYVLKKRERSRTILLERREDYWREKPSIKSVLFRVIADDSVAWKAVRRGDVDVARVNNDLWFRVKDDPAVRDQVQFFDVWQLSYNAIVWNLSDPLFGDVRVRRALAMAFDRESVIREMFHGQARAVSGPFTPDLWAANPAVTPVQYNLQGAAALLSSAGWKDSDGDGVLDRAGKPFAFKLLLIAGNAPSASQSQVFQAALKSIGVQLDLVPLDDAAFFETVLARNFQSAFLAWVNDPDPDPWSLFHSSQVPPAGLNIAGYSNPEADALLVKGRAELDRGRRAEIYHQLHELLARDQPYLWTVQVASKWAVDRRVQNVHTAPGLGLFLWRPGPTEWWLKP
jgi:peptide/nickel transport system substrate-binding protein